MPMKTLYYQHDALFQRILSTLPSMMRRRLRGCAFLGAPPGGLLTSVGQVKNYLRSTGKSIYLHELELPPHLLGLTKQRVRYLEDTTRRSKYHIYLNSTLADPFQRLVVVCHEYGHVMLHSRLFEPNGVAARYLDLSSTDRSGAYTYYAELEANLFALLLLIPDRMVARANQEPFSERAIQTLQSVYADETALHLPVSAAQDRIDAYRVYSEHQAPLFDSWRFTSGAAPDDPERIRNWSWTTFA